MKNSAKTRIAQWRMPGVVPTALAFCFAAAYLLGSSVPPSLSERESSQVDPAVQSAQSAKFVQEPLGRSSFRPDFSSGMRQANQRSNLAMLRSFSDVIANARMSTVIISVGSKQIAYGAIVDSDGWIATKASQLPASGEISCRLYDDREYVAEVNQSVAEIDLALLRIDRTDLTCVQWESSGIPLRGSWLVTTDVNKIPSAVGVVSTGVQTIRSSRAVLGVELVDAVGGAAIYRVLRGSGADDAGLKVGDTIGAVNGLKVTSHRSFQSAISSARGGDVVKLTINRDDRVIEAEARLKDLAEELWEETEMEVNGPVSARATGFNRVLLHDTVLDPNQCGGPLCNLDGKVVGLNIARAGRVASYALPADVVRPLVEGLIAQARLVSRSVLAAQPDSVR